MSRRKPSVGDCCVEETEPFSEQFFYKEMVGTVSLTLTPISMNKHLFQEKGMIH